MAAHRRRNAPARALRIALILAANIAGAWFLWGLAHKPAQAAQAERGATTAPIASADTAAASPRSLPAPKTSAPTPVARDDVGHVSATEHGTTAQLGELGARIRSVVERYKDLAAKLSKGRVDQSSTYVSVHLRDRAHAAEFGLDAGRAMRPASNMKIVTTVSALTLLGPDWQFVTPIEARGTLTAGRLDGDLVLRASGDPLFDAEAEGGVARLLAPALDELQHSGLQSVSGKLVLDEGTFDKPTPPEGWPGQSQRFEEYCALSGGFSANRGCLTVHVSPTSIGDNANIEVEPVGFGLERQFSATTIAAGKATIGFDARPSGLIVRGSIPKSSAPFVGSCPVPDPVELFASVFRHELQARGIRIEGPTVRERKTSPGRVLAAIRTPLSSYLVPINQESNNAVADQLYLATANIFLSNAARSGAEAASLAALDRLHVSGDGFRQVDGSGLSDLNRVSARQLSALIEAVDRGDARISKIYRSSLAVAGVSGTLEKRMRNSPAKGHIFAKTGFIDGTSALSGIAQCKAGGEIVFSIVVNYEECGGLNTSAWKPMGDEICELLVGARL